jgi:hypothetical protein
LPPSIILDEPTDDYEVFPQERRKLMSLKIGAYFSIGGDAYHPVKNAGLFRRALV